MALIRLPVANMVRARGISIDKEGQTKLMFFATDMVGNVGNVQTEIYIIDKTKQLEMKTF